MEAPSAEIWTLSDGRDVLIVSDPRRRPGPARHALGGRAPRPHRAAPAAGRRDRRGGRVRARPHGHDDRGRPCGPESQDRYTEAIVQIGEAKREEKPLPETPEPEQPAQVLDLMAALQESVSNVKRLAARTWARPTSANCRSRRRRPRRSSRPRRPRRRRRLRRRPRGDGREARDLGVPVFSWSYHPFARGGAGHTGPAAECGRIVNHGRRRVCHVGW